MLGLQIGFKSYDLTKGIWGSPWVGLENFKRFITSYSFIRVIRNTLILSAYAIIASFPFPIIFALALNTVKNGRYKKIVQSITYAPHFISVIVIVGMLYQIFHARTGIYGIVYKALYGITPKDIFGDAAVFPHLYVWSGIWQGFGWNSIIYLAALSSVSEELHESAIIDGATRFKVLYIDHPL